MVELRPPHTAAASVLPRECPALTEGKTQGRADTFTADRIVRAVKRAKGRALYAPATPDAATLVGLRAIADLKGWPLAGNPPDNPAGGV